MLYPLSYGCPWRLYTRQQEKPPSLGGSILYMAGPERFELPTYSFVARRSIQLSYGPGKVSIRDEPVYGKPRAQMCLSATRATNYVIIGVVVGLVERDCSRLIVRSRPEPRAHKRPFHRRWPSADPRCDKAPNQPCEYRHNNPRNPLHGGKSCSKYARTTSAGVAAGWLTACVCNKWQLASPLQYTKADEVARERVLRGKLRPEALVRTLSHFPANFGAHPLDGQIS